ncbi:MAG: S8 family serine peptidase [Bacteriovoracaceae bacterium]|jgi:thermitase|nr:S8 family serine peptidase [Bacteriovoracaceae bacterium]
MMKWISTILLLACFCTTYVMASSVPGEFLLKVDTETSGLVLKSKIKRWGVQKSQFLSGKNLIVNLKIPKNRESKTLELIRKDPSILLVEPNYIYRSFTAADPAYRNMWGLKNTGRNTGSWFGGTKGMDINAEKAWTLSKGSDNVVIAIIDTGLDYKHPDLARNVWVNSAEASGTAGVDDDGNGLIDDIHGYDFINDDGDPDDDQGHGTHCAGVIGAIHDNGIGGKGVMDRVKIMPLKFLSSAGFGTLEAAIKAVDYATKMGATLTSNSWGGGEKSDLLFESIKRAQAADILFIAASGNAKNDNDKWGTFPASYKLDNIITVAAYDGYGKRAGFSNYGKTSVHVSAPGVKILSTFKGGRYKKLSGTSMATPHVSGAIGLLLSLYPHLTAAQVKKRVIATSKEVVKLKDVSESGGRMDAYRLLTDDRSR